MQGCAQRAGAGGVGRRLGLAGRAARKALCGGQTARHFSAGRARGMYVRALACTLRSIAWPLTAPFDCTLAPFDCWHVRPAESAVGRASSIPRCAARLAHQCSCSCLAGPAVQIGGRPAPCGMPHLLGPCTSQPLGRWLAGRTRPPQCQRSTWAHVHVCGLLRRYAAWLVLPSPSILHRPARGAHHPRSVAMPTGPAAETSRTGWGCNQPPCRARVCVCVCVCVCACASHACSDVPPGFAIACTWQSVHTRPATATHLYLCRFACLHRVASLSVPM